MAFCLDQLGWNIESNRWRDTIIGGRDRKERRTASGIEELGEHTHTHTV